MQVFFSIYACLLLSTFQYLNIFLLDISLCTQVSLVHYVGILRRGGAHCVETWRQGVMTKRPHVTTWEWELVGFPDLIKYLHESQSYSSSNRNAVYNCSYFYHRDLTSPLGTADHTNPTGHISHPTVYEEPAALSHLGKKKMVLQRSKMVLWSLLMLEKP